MLEIALPHVAAWNSWYRAFGNAVEGYRDLRAQIDDACGSAGRNPADVARTVALLVRFPGGTGRRSGDPTPEPAPIAGDPDALAAALRAFAAEGVSHVQLVLDPITLESIAALEPTLRLLDAN